MPLGFCCCYYYLWYFYLYLDGPGKVHGVDLSSYMVSMATKRLQKQIQEGKVVLYMGSVDSMPYNTDTFDAVYHVNTYYFWPNFREAIRELYRVMKPGSVMVSTLNLPRLKKMAKKGMLKYAYYDPVRYMMCLEKYGFENVHFKYYNEKGKSYQAIFAEITQKAVHYDLDETELDTSQPKYLNVPKKDEGLKN